MLRLNQATDNSQQWKQQSNDGYSTKNNHNNNKGERVNVLGSSFLSHGHAGHVLIMTAKTDTVKASPAARKPEAETARDLLLG